MKISLGNFGYQPRDAVSAQVDRGDPTVMAKAMQNVGEAQLQQASRVNEAWAQAGKSLEQLGQNVFEVIDERARLESANVVQTYRAAKQRHLMDLTTRAANGEIKAKDIDSEMQKFDDAYKPPEVDGLGPMSRKRQDAAMQEVRDQFAPQYAQLKYNKETEELSNALDTNADLNNKNGFDSGQHPAQTAAYFDNPAIIANATRVHGGNASRWLAQKKSEAYKNWWVARLDESHDNRAALAAINAKLSNPEDEDASGLDTDTKLQLGMTTSNRIDQLDAKALAARNAAVNAARLQEERAANIMQGAWKLQDTGATLSPEYSAMVQKATKGTTFEAAAAELPKRELTTQRFMSLAPADRAALISAGDILNRSHRNEAGDLVGADGRKVSLPQMSPAALGLLHLNPNGGTDPKSLENFNAMKRAFEADKSLLHSDPQAHQEQASQQFLQPLNYNLLTTKGSPEQVTQNVRTFIEQANINDRKANLNSAMQQDKSTANTLWKGDESQQLAAVLKDPNIPDTQKAIIHRELYKAGGTPALLGIGADELTTLGAHYSAEYPNDPRGQEIVDYKSYETKLGKTIAGPKDSKIISVLNDAYGDSISPQNKARIAKSIAPIIGYRQTLGGKDPGKADNSSILNVAHDYVGKPVDYYGNTIVLPKTQTATNPGSDFNQIDSRVKYALVGNPNADQIYTYIQRGQLRLEATGDNSFILRMPGENGAVYTDPQTHNVVRLDWSK